MTPGPDPTGASDAASVASPHTTDQERTLALLAHLSLIAGLLVGFLSVLGPILVWMLPADKTPFLVGQAKEALNFQITVYLLGIVAVVATIIMGIATLGIGLAILVPALAILALIVGIFAIIGGLAAYRGEAYRYPVNIRFIS